MQNLISEARLLEASLAGNKEAFGTIVQQYQSLICGITYSATGDFAKSEELAQETFIRAWKGLRQLKDLSKFRAWLCTIARNVVSRSIKRQQKDIINDALSLERLDAVEAAEPGPGQIAISREHEAVVWLALKEIPQKYREPLVLFYREQQSVNQVAAGLELSEHAVRQRLSRGRKLLKAEVAALVEDVLGQTGPTKTFGVVIIAALPALAPQAVAAGTAAVAAKGSAAAKTAFAALLSGAVLGPILGLLGGLFGSWMSIRNTKSPRERWFVIKFTLFVWGEVTLLFLVIGFFLVLALKGMVPMWIYGMVFVAVMTAHVILLVPAIIWGNRQQRQIQIEDGTYVTPEYQPVKMSRANIYGSFGGSILGALCWIFALSVITRDSLVASAVLLFAVGLFIPSAKKCLRSPNKYWQIAIADMMCIAAFTLLILNLRWERWIEFYRHSSGRNFIDIPLWCVNLAIIAVFSGLLAMFVLRYKEQKQLRRKERVLQNGDREK